jgi:dephospho-CoA kinase
VTEGAVARPPLIGLTGGIAAGKSQVLAALARRGAATLSTDALVHELLGTPAVRERVVERWGPELAVGGGIDRGRVGAIVFAAPEELAWLEAELHPRVGERVAEWVRRLPSDAPLGVVEVPLLFETGMDGGFDATLAVVADDERRAERAGRNGVADFDGRGERQLTQAEKASRATYVIHNDGSLEELERAVDELWPRLLARGEER